MYQSDMVYKLKGKNVYILIEHQSTIDNNMPYRMINYYGEILKETINEIATNAYPLIIPIVLYTGERIWKVNTEYSEKITTYKTNKKYIKLEYEIVDIISYAMLIEKNRGKESLVEVLEKISNKCDTNKNKEKMQRIINYILSPILKEVDTERMIEKFKVKEDFDMKTAQDYIREEIREMKKKAQEEGLKEGINFIIINMIKNKMKMEEIKKYTGIEEKEIEKIAANM